MRMAHQAQMMIDPDCAGHQPVCNRRKFFPKRQGDAGTVQAADKELRGATMGLHSMCGYPGGFIGPLGVRLVLDLVGSLQGCSARNGLRRRHL